MIPTELRQSALVPLLVGLTTLAVGVGLGFGLPPFARWLDGVLAQTPLPPFGALDVIGGLPVSWAVPILAGLGLVGGVVLALMTAAEALNLTVADDHIEHRTDDVEGWIERADVTAVHPDGKDLVFLGAGGRATVRLDAEALRASTVRDALRDHGWPWHDDDPYESDYVPWIDGRPGFDAAEHALLRRRRSAGKDAETLTAIDAELAASGLAVRVREGRLQVRRDHRRGDDGASGRS